MPKAKSKSSLSDESKVTDYRHAARRKNIPPAGLAAQGKVQEVPKTRYFYDPHLPPVLRFDETGASDQPPELLETARQRPLTDAEAQLLADALRNRQPWLEWSGKREKAWFDVDPVALHIHERLSAQAIIKMAARQPLQRSFFADPELEYRQAVQFYQHDVDWANRLILGDSLTVMHSLARREDLAGKVQMIYIDPPYGIKFSSNFQPEVGRRDVKDKESDLTREPEQVKAYRDTWTLGTHSYLTYLRDRLILARDLLSNTGSIFVQISDENQHRIRNILDEVFDPINFCSLITFYKTTSQTSSLVASTSDYLLWYAKDRSQVKYHQLYWPKSVETDTAGVYNWLEIQSGERRRMGTIEKHLVSDDSGKIFRLDNMTSQSGGETTSFAVEMEGKTLFSGRGYWKTNIEGMGRLIKVNRVTPSGSTLAYIRFIDDFPVYPIADYWGDTGTGSFTDQKIYVVQTGTKVIERCILMTTDPGDLVLDPTCVRKGTRVVAPLNPPVNRGTSSELESPPSPSTGRVGVGSLSPSTGRVGVGSLSPSTGRVGEGLKTRLIPIESIQPGDFVIAHDGGSGRVLRAIRRNYRGAMVGIRHPRCSQTLWVTSDHYVLSQKRTLSYGADRSWRHVPKEHFQRARELRREMTPSEQRLWRDLRSGQLGVKFRKQHPIGAYIADFYAFRPGLVIEVDGNSHFTPEAQAYDHDRDAYLSSLGLTVLRFTNQEINSHIDGVLKRITEAIAAVKASVNPVQQWRRADSLRLGDIVYFGAGLEPVEITELLYDNTEEEVYDLEVEGAHSFMTEVCAVHNCGSGTTAYVAEQWGRRWITIDTSRVAIALARQRLLTAKYDYYELSDPHQVLPATSSTKPSRTSPSSPSPRTRRSIRSSLNGNLSWRRSWRR